MYTVVNNVIYDNKDNDSVTDKSDSSRNSHRR